MIQHYTPDIKRDLNETKAFEVFKDLIAPFKESVKEYYDNAYFSVELGRIIYGQRRSPIVDIWDDPKIAAIYPYWHAGYENVQGTEALVDFLSVLYTDSEVWLDIQAPLVIGFSVKLREEVEYWWNRDSRYNLPMLGWDQEFEDEKDYQLFVKDSDESEPTTGIVFTTIPINLSADALYKVLKDITYPGLYYYSNLIK